MDNKRLTSFLPLSLASILLCASTGIAISASIAEAKPPATRQLGDIAVSKLQIIAKTREIIVVMTVTMTAIVMTMTTTTMITLIMTGTLYPPELL